MDSLMTGCADDMGLLTSIKPALTAVSKAFQKRRLLTVFLRKIAAVVQANLSLSSQSVEADLPTLAAFLLQFGGC